MLVRSKASLTRAGIFLKTEIFSSVFTKNTHLTRQDGILKYFYLRDRFRKPSFLVPEIAVHVWMEG